MTITDDLLIRYADGEALADEARLVEAALAADPAVAERLAAHQRIAARVKAAFAPVQEAPVPQALLDLLNTSGPLPSESDPTVVPLEQFLDRGCPLGTGKFICFLLGLTGDEIAFPAVLPPNFSGLSRRLHQTVVHPVAGKRLTSAGFGLRQLVFMMREHIVDPSHMDVNRLSEYFHCHGGALQMPTRTARSKGAFPIDASIPFRIIAFP